MSWLAATSLGRPDKAYDPKTDCEFFLAEPATWFALPAGTLAILFPQDAHAAMQGTGQIHKVVVKVAVENSPTGKA